MNRYFVSVGTRKWFASCLLIFVVNSASAQSTSPPAAEGTWSKQQLTDNFWAEGAAVGDANHDGKMDVFYGPYWFAGPDYKQKHVIYSDAKRSKFKDVDGKELEIEGFKGGKTNENEYSDNFLSYSHDLNGDGWIDYIVCGFPGKETFWYENPQGKDIPWKQHVILDVTDNESPMFVQVLGDDCPELVCMSGGQIGVAQRNAEAPSDKWQWIPVSPKMDWQRFTHGIGYGDVNGDGRVDLLDAGGWWEQPSSLDGNPQWTRHEAKFGDGGAQMYVYDVNGDGKNDVISSLSGHGYGVAWFEQTSAGWMQNLITGLPNTASETGVVFSQPHAVVLADMNSDGVMDVVTGKRFWAHGPAGDPEPNAPAVVWWFELQRQKDRAKYMPHLIDAAAGIGTQFAVADMNGDEKPDVITGNKRGSHVLLQK